MDLTISLVIGHMLFLGFRIFPKNIIVLSKGSKIAQIMFEQLSQKPDVPYNAQTGASFQNEVEYKGLGNYKKEYEQSRLSRRYRRQKRILRTFPRKYMQMY